MLYHLKVKQYLDYCLLNLNYVISTVFSETFLKAVEPANMSDKDFSLVFNLKKRLFPFVFWLTYGIVNHSFVRALKPLDKLAVSYFTYFIL